jgi:hypothetical protein
LTVYPALPNNQYRSELYDVIVSQASRSHSLYVYKSTRGAGTQGFFSTDANHWTSFSFSGPVTVRITLQNGAAIKTATVHPLSKQIRAVVTDNTVSFTLTRPANLFVKLDNAPRDPLFIFANPPEVNVPSSATPNVMYFGPGVTDLGSAPFSVADGQTVYLAGGAYVKGRLRMAGPTGSRAVTIRGRGILSGIGITEKRGTFNQFMIDGETRKPEPEVNVEGIVITDSPGPGIIVSGRLQVENVKLFAWTISSDGISGGAGSLVKDCFLKVADDNIHFHVTGMKVIDNVVWLQGAGSALQMGWNEAKSVDGEIADGLDIIGDDFGLTKLKMDWINANIVALIDVHSHASYKNIVVENVRHEGRPYQLFGVRTRLAAEDPGHAEYREGKGSVDGMLLRNIIASQQPLHPSVFDGNGSEPGTIQNVIFENIQIAGDPVKEKNASTYLVQRGKTSCFRYIVRANPTPDASNR